MEKNSRRRREHERVVRGRREHERVVRGRREHERVVRGRREGIVWRKRVGGEEDTRGILESRKMSQI